MPSRLNSATGDRLEASTSDALDGETFLLLLQTGIVRDTVLPALDTERRHLRCSSGTMLSGDESAGVDGERTSRWNAEDGKGKKKEKDGSVG